MTCLIPLGRSLSASNDALYGNHSRLDFTRGTPLELEFRVAACGTK
jgi:hypothetical protein